MPPLLATHFDPTLSSRIIHAAVVGSLGTTFFLTDRFFAGIRAKYSDLHKSAALTERVAISVQHQVSSIDAKLNLMWSISMLVRVLQALLVPLLALLNTQTLAYFYLVIFAYSTLGISFFLMIYFWVVSRQAQKFRSWFDIAELQEKRRVEELKDFEPKQWVNS